MKPPIILTATEYSNHWQQNNNMTCSTIATNQHFIFPGRYGKDCSSKELHDYNASEHVVHQICRTGIYIIFNTIFVITGFITKGKQTSWSQYTSCTLRLVNKLRNTRVKSIFALASTVLDDLCHTPCHDDAEIQAHVINNI